MFNTLNLFKFKKDLDQKHKVALSSNASLLDIKDFVDQFNLGKSLDIAKEDLEETEKSFAMLSKHLHVVCFSCMLLYWY